MERKPSVGDLQRNRELHELIDQIEVPEGSFSDMSSELISGRSAYDHDSSAYKDMQTSPERPPIEDFFESSMNSTINQNTDIEHPRHLNFDESRPESSCSQPQSRAFTPKQISKMMNWSRAHITQTEGLFPQVSAPSMSIDQDLDFWDQSQNDSSMPPALVRPHSSIEKIDIAIPSSRRPGSSHGLPVLDYPTHDENEALTFSPGNHDQGWFMGPTDINSKRSSANNSFRANKKGNLASDAISQGSALLSNQMKTHDASLIQARENSIIYDDNQKLKNDISNIKIALKKEQEMHEITQKELYDNAAYAKKLEAERGDFLQKISDLEEHLKMLQYKYKDQSSLEQMQGKSLGYAREEIRQLKLYIDEKDKKIEDLTHALSQRSIIESTTPREKEIEELTMEISGLKIVNNAKMKEIQAHLDKIDFLQKSKEQLENEFLAFKQSSEVKLNQFDQQLKKEKAKNEEKDKEILNLKEAFNEASKKLKIFNEDSQKEFDDLKMAKLQIETLETQLNDVQAGRTTNADYETHLNKIKDQYEKKILKSQDENNILKKRISSYEEEISQLKWQINSKNKPETAIDDLEEKETIAIMEAEIHNMHQEIIDLTAKIEEYKNNDRNSNEIIHDLNDKIEELAQELEEEKSKKKSDIRIIENNQLEQNKTIRRLESELQLSKELASQYQEEMENLRHANNQAQNLIDNYKRQIEEQRGHLHRDSLKKIELEKDEPNQEAQKLKSSLQSLQAKYKAETEDLLQTLKERDERIEELENEISSYPDPENLEKDIREEYEKKIAIFEKKISESEKENKTKIRIIEEKYEKNLELKLDECEKLFKEKIEEIRTKYEKERSNLIDRFEHEKSDLEDEIKRLKNEIKIRSEKIMQHEKTQEELLSIDDTLSSRLEEMEIEYKEKIQEFKSKLSKDFTEKEQKINMECEENIRKIKEDCDKQIQIERERHQDLMNIKEQSLLLDTQRSQDELLVILQEKEKEWQELLKKEKNQLEKELLLKEQKIESLKEAHEIEQKRIKEEIKQDYKEKLNNAKQEHLKQKREWEREQRKLKEAAENSLEAAKKEVEVSELEKLNHERKEWERKTKQKISLMQSKHQKELQDKEESLKLEAEKEKNEAIKSITEQLKKTFKQREEETKKFFEEVKEAALIEKSHEIEIKIRKELQENYINAVKQLEEQYAKEKETLREELHKRSEDFRKQSCLTSFDSSYYSDMPFSSGRKRWGGDEENEGFSGKKNELEEVYKYLEAEVENYINFQMWLKTPNRNMKKKFSEFTELLSVFVNSLQMMWESQHKAELEEMKQEINKKMEIQLAVKKRQSSSLTENEGQNIIKYSEEIAKLRVALEEYKERQRRYEEELKNTAMIKEKQRKYEDELKNLSQEYKNHMLKTKKWIENATNEKTAWNEERSRLSQAIEELTVKLKDSEENQPISPEMLSPEETCNLVLSIFNRSNKDSLITQMLQKNSDFIFILQEFIDHNTVRRRNLSYQENLTYDLPTQNHKLAYPPNAHHSEILDTYISSTPRGFTNQSKVDTSLPPYLPHHRSSPWLIKS
ncbi:unnamed protein product [Blepharisma stoltei]|uniref:Uncharacterized protein n=1 Tax=Blepharisma stoltei TaxID=1481888 RepID=A0AAU9JR35_9CILI|nr:unnamed protein product [Blepharisma stoltei]